MQFASADGISTGGDFLSSSPQSAMKASACWLGAPAGASLVVIVEYASDDRSLLFPHLIGLGGCVSGRRSDWRQGG